MTSAMTRTITLPGHTETQTDNYSGTSDCSGVLVETGKVNGRWGELTAVPETLPTQYFMEYAFYGWAGMNQAWTSSREYGSAAHVSVDLYGNKAISTKVGVIMHPLTGAGDADTKGWV